MLTLRTLDALVYGCIVYLIQDFLQNGAAMIKIVCLTLLFSSVAFASEVKVNSFRFTGSRTTTAEICGELVSPTGKPEFLKVIVDVGTKYEVPYYVWAGPDGKFCSVVSTVYGKADVEIQK
jgi:hypothetical protein